jgi:histidine phosphotransfer protein HptB
MLKQVQHDGQEKRPDLGVTLLRVVNPVFTLFPQYGAWLGGTPVGVGDLAVFEISGPIVDWAVFSRARAELGAGFVRILSYFREDGAKSVAAIEEAIRAGSATALVIPAHTLKGESAQFGAEPLAALAEHIETIARRCVEHHETPDELIEDVVKLRPLFEQTLALFDRETNPLMDRRPAFGRKTAATFGGA